MRKFVNWEEAEDKKWYTCHACGRKTDKPKDETRCPVCGKPLWEILVELARKAKIAKKEVDSSEKAK